LSIIKSEDHIIFKTLKPEQLLSFDIEGCSEQFSKESQWQMIGHAYSTGPLGSSLEAMATEKTTEEQLQANVWKIIWFNGIFSVFSSIAQLGLFDTYLFIMAGNSNTAVGWAESISGLSQIVLAGPAGILTDTVSRSKLLRWCVVLAILAVVASIAGIGLDNFPIIYVSLFIFGAYSAIQNTASFALYSDSIPQGSRAKWLSRVSIVNQLGYGAGPFFSLFLFAYFGNEWPLVSSFWHMGSIQRTL